MPTLTEKFNTAQEKQMPEIHPGDTVRVHQKVKEGDKERIQIFEGVVIAKKHGKGISGTITVRKVVEGVGAERIFPVHAPIISKIELVRSAKVRRSKLYYLRSAKGKKAKLKKKDFAAAIVDDQPAIVEEAAPEATETPVQEVAENQAPKTAE